MLHLIWFNQALPKFSFIWRLIPDMQLSGWNRAQQHRPKPNESAFGPNVIFFLQQIIGSSQRQHTLPLEQRIKTNQPVLGWKYNDSQEWTLSHVNNNVLCALKPIGASEKMRIQQRITIENGMNESCSLNTNWLPLLSFCTEKRVIIRFYCVVTWPHRVDNNLNDSIENITQWMQINLNNSIRFHVKWIEWNELKSQAIDEKCWDLFDCP